MRELGEFAVIFAASALGILSICGLGWFVFVVVAPLGWALAILFAGLLATVIGLVNLFAAQR